MRFKIFFSIAIVLATTFFILSCDDNIDSIGQSIQPGMDDILLDVDHVLISAQTVAGEKNVYIETDQAVLGEIDDPVFGKLKSDFLAEFFCLDDEFVLGYDGKATIDSVTFQVGYLYSGLIGDSISPMAITVYELSNPEGLIPTYFTNIDPSKYCDKQRVLGQRFFSPKDLPKAGTLGKYLNIEVDKAYGENLYNKWMEDKKVLSNSEELRKVLKGIYVTTDFSNKSIINIGDANSQVRMMINYKYIVSKKKNEPTVDSILYTDLTLPIAADAIKLNHVWNSPLADIVGVENNKVNTFVKSPAGVHTQISIPLKEIKEKAEEKTKSDKFIINSAIFKLTGMTEAEDKLSIDRRPSRLLFIHKDSVENFFLKGKKPDGVSSMVLVRNSTNNTYNFSNANTTSVSNNLANTINHYLKREKDEEITIDELEYLIIPINTTEVAVSQYVSQITAVSNLFSPSTAIFRTDDKFMKMSLIFSKHSEIAETKR